MKRYFRSVLALALVAGLAACAGQTDSDSRSDRDRGDRADRSSAAEGSTITATGDEGIRQRIEASGMFGSDPSMEINDIGVADLREVVVNGMVLYSDADGRHLIQGEILEVDSRYNLTTATRARLRATKMEQLEVDDAIVYKPKGEVKAVLNVFTDVECGFCRTFHEQIDKYTEQGLEIHYYPWPRSGPQGPVYEEMVDVWCAKDQKKAITQSKQGKKPADASCDHPVEKYYALGAEMGIQGTPAIFLEDGSQIGGYIPPDAISGVIDQVRTEAENNAAKQRGE